MKKKELIDRKLIKEFVFNIIKNVPDFNEESFVKIIDATIDSVKDYLLGKINKDILINSVNRELVNKGVDFRLREKIIKDFFNEMLNEAIKITRKKIDDIELRYFIELVKKEILSDVLVLNKVIFSWEYLERLNLTEFVLNHVKEIQQNSPELLVKLQNIFNLTIYKNVLRLNYNQINKMIFLANKYDFKDASGKTVVYNILESLFRYKMIGSDDENEQEINEFINIVLLNNLVSLKVLFKDKEAFSLFDRFLDEYIYDVDNLNIDSVKEIIRRILNDYMKNDILIQNLEKIDFILKNNLFLYLFVKEENILKMFDFDEHTRTLALDIISRFVDKSFREENFFSLNGAALITNDFFNNPYSINYIYKNKTHGTFFDLLYKSYSLYGKLNVSERVFLAMFDNINPRELSIIHQSKYKSSVLYRIFLSEYSAKLKVKIMQMAILTDNPELLAKLIKIIVHLKDIESLKYFADKYFKSLSQMPMEFDFVEEILKTKWLSYGKCYSDKVKVILSQNIKYAFDSKEITNFLLKKIGDKTIYSILTNVGVFDYYVDISFLKKNVNKEGSEYLVFEICRNLLKKMKFDFDISVVIDLRDILKFWGKSKNIKKVSINSLSNVFMVLSSLRQGSDWLKELVNKNVISKQEVNLIKTILTKCLNYGHDYSVEVIANKNIFPRKVGLNLYNKVMEFSLYHGMLDTLNAGLVKKQNSTEDFLGYLFEESKCTKEYFGTISKLIASNIIFTAKNKSDKINCNNVFLNSVKFLIDNFDKLDDRLGCLQHELSFVFELLSLEQQKKLAGYLKEKGVLIDDYNKVFKKIFIKTESVVSYYSNKMLHEKIVFLESNLQKKENEVRVKDLCLDLSKELEKKLDIRAIIKVKDILKNKSSKSKIFKSSLESISNVFMVLAELGFGSEWLKELVSKKTISKIEVDLLEIILRKCIEQDLKRYVAIIANKKIFPLRFSDELNHLVMHYSLDNKMLDIFNKGLVLNQEMTFYIISDLIKKLSYGSLAYVGDLIGSNIVFYINNGSRSIKCDDVFLSCLKLFSEIPSDLGNGVEVLSDALMYQFSRLNIENKLKLLFFGIKYSDMKNNFQFVFLKMLFTKILEETYEGFKNKHRDDLAINLVSNILKGFLVKENLTTLEKRQNLLTFIKMVIEKMAILFPNKGLLNIFIKLILSKKTDSNNGYGVLKEEFLYSVQKQIFLLNHRELIEDELYFDRLFHKEMRKFCGNQIVLQCDIKRLVQDFKISKDKVFKSKFQNKIDILINKTNLPFDVIDIILDYDSCLEKDIWVMPLFQSYLNKSCAIVNLNNLICTVSSNLFNLSEFLLNPNFEEVKFLFMKNSDGKYELYKKNKTNILSKAKISKSKVLNELEFAELKKLSLEQSNPLNESLKEMLILYTRPSCTLLQNYKLVLGQAKKEMFFEKTLSKKNTL